MVMVFSLIFAGRWSYYFRAPGDHKLVVPSDLSLCLLLFTLLIHAFCFLLFAVPYFNIELTKLSLDKKSSNPVLM